MDVWRNVAVDNGGDAGNQVVAAGTAITLHRLIAANTHATSTAFIHIYRAEHGDVTPGTTTPYLTIPITAGDSVSLEVGIRTLTGLTICASDAAAGSGSAVSAVVVSALYG